MAEAATSPPNGAMERIAALVEARTGLGFSRGRWGELVLKTSQIFKASQLPTWDPFLKALDNPADDLLTQLIEVLTIGETYFFRHQSHFEALERVVLPELIARRSGGGELRLWSAACATGEEPYSLAILLRKLLPSIAPVGAGSSPALGNGWFATILATDINRAFLARAERAEYGEWSFRQTDTEFRPANFTRAGTRYRVDAKVRRLVRFTPLNLIQAHYPSVANSTTSMDVIFCRNVLMYFSPEVAAGVVARLRAALKPNGWLFLGPSDVLPGMMTGFEMHQEHGALLYRRVDPAPGSAPTPARPAAVLPPRLAAKHPRPAPVLHRPGSIAHPVSPRRTRPREPQAETAPPAASDDWHAAWHAARSSANRGDLADAERHCRDVMVMAGHRPEPYYLLGTLRQSQGDPEAALAAFRQALYVDRSFAPAHLAVAAIQRRAGRPELAEQAVARARALLSGRAADEVLLADEGLTVGRLRDALDQMSTGRNTEGGA